MFRIRRILDAALPINKRAIAEVQELIRELFPGVKEEKINEIPEQLANPLKYKFKAILFVVDDLKYNLKGFGLVFHATDLNFSFLDFMAVKREYFGKGFGGAIYSRIREELMSQKSSGLFLECLPDDESCSTMEILEPNKKRLRFYETFGARPIVNTAYQTSVSPEDKDMPFLVYDSLSRETPLSQEELRKFVRAILERKYGYLCSPEYVEKIISSINEDPVVLRPYKYVKEGKLTALNKTEKVVLLVNEKHEIHHVKDRGYVESPTRVKSILKEVEKTDFFERVEARNFSEDWIRRVHDKEYINFFKTIIKKIKPSDSIYPYVFPIRNANRPPKELDVRAGYYCIDTFTPISINAFNAAKEAVDCALTGAEKILEGKKLVYALIRPPGHHAEKKSFGGFCYFNSNAIAAEFLSEHGRVAILDVDYHHGNGQQNIFYHRNNVLTVSIHGHPDFAYPYFSGFKDEDGEGAGKGFNINLPLKEKIIYEEYKETLLYAINKIKEFEPDFLVVAFGLDTAKKDPTGTWSLEYKDFEENGELISLLGLPTLVVQEGGYNTRTMGKNAVSFLRGLAGGLLI
ncbi:MAG: histone deacetylase family protein [Nanoarchaeota archaeon]|nr:histone deacetylase family protein [Nanoarchaeota archaeon]MBU0977396.1 histone deacetylase family protein [Nanoarchaeota archaeon]